MQTKATSMINALFHPFYKKVITILFVSIFCIAHVRGSSASEQHPDIGSVYNTQESNKLEYSCRLQNGELTCEFVQISVRSDNKTKEEFERDLESEMKKFARDRKGTVGKLCTPIENQISSVKQKSASEIGVSVRNYQRLSSLLENVRVFCKDPNDKNYRAMLVQALGSGVGLCRLEVNKFSQKFRETENGSWIVISAPSGECGSVQLDRFEFDKQSKYWNYFARKAIINKNARHEIPGISCSQLDEREYQYNWRIREVTHDCDVIKY